eukprot:TRINITY_DN110126_c0_g1_i1.p1 TRINITY_DN110126_c0_g1~~TRINITY_DN110126_c0_g1_i1.p1  ORF type:complete len:328 (-),score=64.52 TRINITY_DN110126_c0_g1_i1:104-1021(-)
MARDRAQPLSSCKDSGRGRARRGHLTLFLQVFTAVIAINALSWCYLSAQSFVASSSSSSRRQSGLSFRRPIALKALPQEAKEKKVLKLSDEYPASDEADADDKDELMDAVKALGSVAAPETAYDLFPGEWKVEWSSIGGRFGGRAFAKSRNPVPLEFLSFDALPRVPVLITGSYNRVIGDGKSGTYQLLQTFTMPDSEGVEAAMMLEGSWSTGTASGNWGKGAARTRVPIQFETVRLLTATENSDESLAMLKKADLDKFLEPKSVTARKTYIDLDHISSEMRIHKGESGAVYVLTRLKDEKIPFE